MRKLDISKLEKLYPNHESLEFKRMVLSEWRAHIGHFQCFDIEEIVADEPCTVCFGHAMQPFGVDEKVTEIIWPAITGERDFAADKKRSESKHELRKQVAYQQGLDTAREVIAKGQGDVVTYDGPEFEEFRRGLEAAIAETESPESDRSAALTFEGTTEEFLQYMERGFGDTPKKH